MKKLALIILAAACANAATIKTTRPRTLTAHKITHLQNGRINGTAEHLGLKAYVDGIASPPTLLNYPEQSNRLAALLFAAGESSTYCSAKAVPWTMQLLDLTPEYTIVSAVSNGSTTDITLNAPHGIATNAVQKFNIDSVTGAWYGLNGEYDMTATGANTLRVPKNSSTYGTYSGNGGDVYHVQKNNRDFGIDDGRGFWWTTAQTFDICRSYFTAPEAARVVKYLSAIVRYQQDYTGTYKYGTAQSDKDWAGNLSTGKTILLAYATAALHGEWAEAQTRFDTNRNYILNKIVHKMDVGIFKGGGAGEGGEEYEWATLKYVLGSIDAVKAASDEDLFTIAGSTWLTDAAAQMFHMTSPTAPTGHADARPWPMGDYQGDYAEWSYRARVWGILLWSKLNEEGHTSTAQKVKRWIDENKPQYGSSSNPSDNYFTEIFFDSTAASAEWRTGSTDAFFAGNNRVFSRSDWTTAATWMGTHCSETVGSDHIHGDCGQVQMWRKGEWLTKEDEGYSAPTASPLSHSIFVPGGVSGCQSNAGPCSTVSFPVTSGATVATKLAPTLNSTGTLGAISYNYTAIDMTSVYRYQSNSSSTVSKVDRSVLYLKPDTIIVMDYAKFGTGLNRIALQTWQTENAPTIVGRRLTHTTGDQKLYIDATYPTTATAATANNDDKTWVYAITRTSPAIVWYAFNPANGTTSGGTGDWTVANTAWAGFNGGRYRVQSYTAPSVTAVATPYCPSSSGMLEAVPNGVTHNVVTWQSMIGSCTEANVQHMMTVLRGADAADAAPSAPSELTATNAIARQVGDDVIIMQNGPDGTPTLPITVSGIALAPQTRIYITRMARSTAYNVDANTTPGTVTISAGSGATANTAGLITTTASSGGTVITLATSVSSRSFTATSGGSNPSSQTFDATATGGTAALTIAKIGADCGWLTLSPTSGNSPQTITASVNISGVSAGPHTCSARVSSATTGVTNSPLSVAINLTVAAATTPLTLTGPPDQQWVLGRVGEAFSEQMTAAGGTAPYTYSVLTGTLSPGLSLNTSTGAIAGTPTDIGDFPGVVIQVTDAAAATATAVVQTRIRPALTGLSIRRVVALSDQIVVWFDGANDANTTCTLVVRDAGGDVASTMIVPRGARLRRIVVEGLAPGGVYTPDLACSGLKGTSGAAITLPVASPSTTVVRMSVAADGADNIIVEYGAAVDSLTNTSPEATCSAGRCTVALTLATDAIWYYRVKWRDASDVVLTTGRIRSLEIE
jgi:hypothetical protein